MKKNEIPKKNLPRRDFVKAAFAGIGATTLAGIGARGAEAANVARHWDKIADVVIVGAGATGLPASIEAAEHGASVIVIDQNYDIGGTRHRKRGEYRSRGRDEFTEKIRHRGFARPHVRGPGELARLQIQRQRNCPRFLRLERPNL